MFVFGAFQVTNSIVYLNYKASWFIICGMAIKYKKKWVHMFIGVPSNVFLFNLGL